MTEREIQDLIILNCEKLKLNIQLTLAIALQESAFNANVVRFEPKWRYHYQTELFARKLKVTQMTETVLQSISWGPLQVMGSVCRELGYTDHLTLLVDPVLSVSLGCQKLHQISKRYPEESDIIATYNAGAPRRQENGEYANQSYVTSVTRKLLLLRQ